jgi:hypothetical protein
MARTTVRLKCAFGTHFPPSLPDSEYSTLKNPWMKKNPFLSMWLSGANAVAGAARSRATAEAKRQAATKMTKNSKEVARYWNTALFGPAPKKRKRRR